MESAIRALRFRLNVMSLSRHACTDKTLMGNRWSACGQQEEFLQYTIGIHVSIYLKVLSILSQTRSEYFIFNIVNNRPLTTFKSMDYFYTL